MEGVVKQVESRADFTLLVDRGIHPFYIDMDLAQLLLELWTWSISKVENVVDLGILELTVQKNSKDIVLCFWGSDTDSVFKYDVQSLYSISTEHAVIQSDYIICGNTIHEISNRLDIDFVSDADSIDEIEGQIYQDYENKQETLSIFTQNDVALNVTVCKADDEFEKARKSRAR